MNGVQEIKFGDRPLGWLKEEAEKAARVHIELRKLLGLKPERCRLCGNPNDSDRNKISFWADDVCMGCAVFIRQGINDNHT